MCSELDGLMRYDQVRPETAHGVRPAGSRPHPFPGHRMPPTTGGTCSAARRLPLSVSRRRWPRAGAWPVTGACQRLDTRRISRAASSCTTCTTGVAYAKLRRTTARRDRYGRSASVITIFSMARVSGACRLRGFSSSPPSRCGRRGRAGALVCPRPGDRPRRDRLRGLAHRGGFPGGRTSGRMPGRQLNSPARAHSTCSDGLPVRPGLGKAESRARSDGRLLALARDGVVAVRLDSADDRRVNGRVSEADHRFR